MPITTGGWTSEFKVSGYADDTAVYLRDRSAIMPVITILDDWLTCRVSGRIGRNQW